MIKSASKYQDNLKNFYSDIVHNQLGGKPPYYDGRDNFVEPNPHELK